MDVVKMSYFCPQDGMNQYAYSISYHTFHNGRCFAIERFATDSTTQAMSKSERKKRTDVERIYYKATEKIVKSLRFLK
jgi:hypothetical protein